MPTPSLLIVPARFKSGKMYSQIPTSGAGDFTVTRATTATRVNASGLIESVASGIPRLDYFASGGTVGCPALLVEPAGTNLAFHSTDWTSNWNAGAANGTTITTGSTSAFTAPDGTATANEIHPTSGNTGHPRIQNSTFSISYVSGTVYTQSAFFKAGAGTIGRFVQLSYAAAIFTQNGHANFDLQLGTVAVVSGTSADTNRAARIENYGNGWYRCSFTATCPSTGTGNGVIAILIQASGDTRFPSFAGTVTDYVLGWGAQVETGSVATSYIPTTTASVTRNADTITVSGAVSGSIGQSEGTIYWDIPLVNGVITGTGNPQFGIRNTAFTNWIGLTSNGLASPFRITANSTTGSLINYQANITSGKAALAWSSDGLVLYVNGTSVATSATNPNFSFNRVDIIGLMVFKANALALYTTRLTNTQLAALTTP